MPVLRRVFLCALLACLAAGGARAQPDYELEIRSVSVTRSGYVQVDYTIRNSTDILVCVPVDSGLPRAGVQPFRAKDDAALLGEGEVQAPQIKTFRSTYREVTPGLSLWGRTQFSVYDFPVAAAAQTGQAVFPPTPSQDYLYVILSMPIRSCPLLPLSSKIAFNRPLISDPTVRSLPSQLFSVSRPGKY